MFLFEFGPKQLPPPGHTRQKSGHPLLQTLLKNRNKSSSDPRDKVFGLLGIVNSNSIGHDQLQINYNLPVKDVYSGVVQAVVGTTQRLDIICSSRPGVLVGGWNVRPEQLKLPSWAPDWSVCPSVRRFNNMGVLSELLAHLLPKRSSAQMDKFLQLKDFVWALSAYVEMCVTSEILQRTLKVGVI